MKKDEIREKIIKFLEKQDWPVTTEQIAKELKISWNTAQLHLLKLVVEGIVKIGRQNQFWLARKYKKEFKKD